MNNKDLQFVKKFSSINIKGICKDLNINNSNVLSGRTSNENIKKVKLSIINHLIELFSEEDIENYNTIRIIDLIKKEIERR